MEIKKDKDIIKNAKKTRPLQNSPEVLQAGENFQQNCQQLLTDFFIYVKIG